MADVAGRLARVGACIHHVVGAAILAEGRAVLAAAIVPPVTVLAIPRAARLPVLRHYATFAGAP